jgi:hypothetical protein
MSGVVYAIGSAGPPPVGAGLLGKFGEEITVTNLVPPGNFYIAGPFTVTDQDGNAHAHQPGLCLSDGFNVTAPGQIAIPLGAGKDIVWPWPPPWPMMHLPWPATM